MKGKQHHKAERGKVILARGERLESGYGQIY